MPLVVGAGDAAGDKVRQHELVQHAAGGGDLLSGGPGIRRWPKEAGVRLRRPQVVGVRQVDLVEPWRRHLWAGFRVQGQD